MGQPYPVEVYGRDEAVRRYEADLARDQLVTKTPRRTHIITRADVRRELAGKTLMCWCKPDEPCHADVLLRIADQEPS